ncbi:hypothetical protein PTKU46_86710 [Paraburkholderia terrae]
MQPAAAGSRIAPVILLTGVEQRTEDEYAAYPRGEGLLDPCPLACHFVTNGRIQFLGDSSHKLAEIGA